MQSVGLLSGLAEPSLRVPTQLFRLPGQSGPEQHPLLTGREDGTRLECPSMFLWRRIPVMSSWEGTDIKQLDVLQEEPEQGWSFPSQSLRSLLKMFLLTEFYSEKRVIFIFSIFPP